MVGGEHDQARIKEPAFLEFVQEPTDLGVYIPDFGIILGNVVVPVGVAINIDVLGKGTIGPKLIRRERYIFLSPQGVTDKHLVILGRRLVWGVGLEVVNPEKKWTVVILSIEVIECLDGLVSDVVLIVRHLSPELKSPRKSELTTRSSVGYDCSGGVTFVFELIREVEHPSGERLRDLTYSVNVWGTAGEE
jgi:hypothetical protein